MLCYQSEVSSSASVVPGWCLIPFILCCVERKNKAHHLVAGRSDAVNQNVAGFSKNLFPFSWHTLCKDSILSVVYGHFPILPNLLYTIIFASYLFILHLELKHLEDIVDSATDIWSRTAGEPSVKGNRGDVNTCWKPEAYVWKGAHGAGRNQVSVTTMYRFIRYKFWHKVN